MIFLELVKASASSMLCLVLICIIGGLGAIYPSGQPMFAPNARRDMGFMTVNLALPCLCISSIGSTLHGKELSVVWDLLLWSFANIAGGGSIALAVSRSFLHLKSEAEAAFCMAGAFGNSLSLPILMMVTLCRQDVVLKHFSDAEQCTTISYAYLMTYVIVFQMCLYGIASPLLQRTVKRANEERSTTMRHPFELVLPTELIKAPRKVDIQDCESGGSIEMVRSSIGPGTLPCGSTDSEDDGVLKEATMVADNRSTEISRGPDVEKSGDQGHPEETILVSILRSFRTPPIAGPVVGIAIGLCRPLSNALFRGNSLLAAAGTAMMTLGDIGVGLSVLIMAAALVYSPSSPKKNDSELGSIAAPERIPFTTSAVVALCIIRLVLLPAAGIFVCSLALRAGVFERSPEGGLRALLIMIEWGTPSAQMVIVAMTTLQFHELAQQMAKAYLILYPLSIITLTAWTSLALYLVEREIWGSLGASS